MFETLHIFFFEKNELQELIKKKKLNDWVIHYNLKELGKHEETLTREIKEAKDSGVKMWTMINKRKGMEREEKETPLYDGEGDRKSTRLNSSHSAKSRMPSSA